MVVDEQRCKPVDRAFEGEVVRGFKGSWLGFCWKTGSGSGSEDRGEGGEDWRSE